METIPDNPLVVWALATSPTFHNHRSAVEKFVDLQFEYDSLVAVEKKKTFLVKEIELIIVDMTAL